MFDWAKYEKDGALLIASGMRRGQAYVNALHNTSPELYAELANRPDVDPFYDDTMIGTFIDWLACMTGR